MSTSIICLPAHILDANISPRAREVLMLLASQTSVADPALWICQKTIAARLRCSVATVARSIQKLVAAKLIAETGRLHDGRYKFYHIRWSTDENLKAVEKKIKTPVRRVAASKIPREKNPPTPFCKGGEGTPAAVQEIFPPLQKEASLTEPGRREAGGFDFPAPQNADPQSTLSPPAMLANSRIAHFAEIARKQHEENKRRYNAILLSLSSSSGV